MAKNKQQPLPSKPPLPTEILIIVEGETEEGYFLGLKVNSYLKNRLSDYKVAIASNFITSINLANENIDKYKEIWIVTDNDKRNAFVLVEKKDCVFKKLLPSAFLPQAIIDSLLRAYNDNEHRYFLSVYDYMQWIASVIGTSDTIMYWDILSNATMKGKDFEKYYHPIKGTTLDSKIKLAYSCIAFEFWILLHFEQSKHSFIWNEHHKGPLLDVFDYITDKHRGNYKKGNNGRCTAYSCLYNDDYAADSREATDKDDWMAIYRVILAYKNAIWLRRQMQSVLERQSGKWWEVNPYINEGVNELIGELLNIKKIDTDIDVDDWKIKISVIERGEASFSLNFEILENQSGAFMINNESHKENFQIKNDREIFLPKGFEPIDCLEKKCIKLEYDIPFDQQGHCILIFKNPASRHTTDLMILLD